VSAEPQSSDQTEKALEEALAERNRLWSELNRERADQRELEYLRRELKEIHDSPWWKAVAAFKRVKRLAGAVRKRLRDR
jgi:hypothetical protein